MELIDNFMYKNIFNNFVCWNTQVSSQHMIKDKIQLKKPKKNVMSVIIFYNFKCNNDAYQNMTVN
jgi:hypothetical protein